MWPLVCSQQWLFLVIVSLQVNIFPFLYSDERLPVTVESEDGDEQLSCILPCWFLGGTVQLYKTINCMHMQHKVEKISMMSCTTVFSFWTIMSTVQNNLQPLSKIFQFLYQVTATDQNSWIRGGCLDLCQMNDITFSSCTFFSHLFFKFRHLDFLNTIIQSFLAFWKTDSEWISVIGTPEGRNATFSTVINLIINIYSTCPWNTKPAVTFKILTFLYYVFCTQFSVTTSVNYYIMKSLWFP